MKHQSQLKTIKKHLLEGYLISSYEAFKRYGITRLSEHIHRLRRAGFKIDSIWSGVGTGKFKEYFISESNLYYENGNKV